MNDDSRIAPKPRHEAAQRGQSKRDATRGRLKTRPGHMNEDRAAPPRHSRTCVVIDFDDEVIKPVLAPQAIGRRTFGYPDRPVVAGMVRLLAPAVRTSDQPDWQAGLRTRTTVGAPPQAQRPKSPARCRSIAFAFVRPNPRPPECDPQLQRTGVEQALRPRSGACPHPNRGERFPHGFLRFARSSTSCRFSEISWGKTRTCSLNCSLLLAMAMCRRWMAG